MNNFIFTDSLTYDNPHFKDQEWDNGSFTIQKWLERTPWKSLKNSYYGRNKQESHIPELLTDPLLQQVYMIDLALFISAEKSSVNTCAQMMSFAPDEKSLGYLATQVLDESRHYEMFCRRVADFGVSPEKRDELVKNYTTPEMQKLFDLIAEQVDKKDFYAATVAQNIVLEGMAYPIYRYEMKYWSYIDPNLSKMIQSAFVDEAHHVHYGESIICSAIKGNDKKLKNKLSNLHNDFSKLLTEVFEKIIHHYIGVYQACADEYMEHMGNIEIFPGHLMKDVNEEMQARILLNEIEKEQTMRMNKIGLN